MIGLGIDPGLTGAMALVSSLDGLLDVIDLPTCPNGIASGAMRSWLDVRTLDAMLGDLARRHVLANEAVQVVIERPVPMPSLPAQTVAVQFDTVGAIRGLLAARTWGRDVLMVTPQRWKAAYRLKADKAESRAAALRLYPSAPVTRAKDHNRAEAILLADFGIREVVG